MTSEASTSGPDEQTAPRTSGPPYPQQPVDSERPVPMRDRPERTQDPADWDAASREPLTASAPDLAEQELRDRRAEERDTQAEGGAPSRAPGSDEESSYSTEQEQGAAQPGPGDV